MNEPRGGTSDRIPAQQQTSKTSPRSPVKLADYANIRRPPRQQVHKPQQQDIQDQRPTDAITNGNGKSAFQRELEGVINERKKRGLVTGFSDSENSLEDVEHENNNVVDAGYFAKVDHQEDDQWQHHNDSIPFSSDVSLNQSNDGRSAYNDNEDVRQQHTDRSLSQRSSLYEFENMETVMNQQSQSSTGILDVVEESSENGTKDGSLRNTLRGSEAGDGSGFEGDILHLDDNDGSGIMNESELREHGVLFDESSSSPNDYDHHGDDDDHHHRGDVDERLPPEDSDLVMKMYMQASPRPPGYPEEEYEQSDDEYAFPLKESVDDVAERMMQEGLSEEEDREESIPSGYSDNASDLSGDLDHQTNNGHGSDHKSEFDDQSQRSQRSNHRPNGQVNRPEPVEFSNFVNPSPRSGNQSRLSARSFVSDTFSQDDSEFGNTVVENKAHLNAAILAAAAKVESFVDEPEGESDATSVSLGQFVPNAVQRTRLPPPGQRRSSVKGYRNSSIDKPTNLVNLVSASKRSSPRTTPRRSKSNSIRSKSGASSPRGSVRAPSPQDSERSTSQFSVKSISQYSEKSARSMNESISQFSEASVRSVSEAAAYLAKAADGSSSINDLPTELPTLMSMYLGNGKGMRYPRPEGVPPLDFGASINSNISFLPRDDFQAISQAEELAEQLQKDYDSLLAKYAQAENTIDQLRLGAKVNLFGDDPVPGQAVEGSFGGAKQPQVIQFGQPQKASVQHVVNVSHIHTSTGAGDGSQLGDPSARTPHTPFMHTVIPPSPRAPFMQTVIPASGRGGNQEGADDGLEFPAEASAGGKAVALMFQAKDLQEQVFAFDDLVKQNQITPPEQKTVYDQLKGAHEKLESEYMQAKEEDNAMRRRNSLFNNGDEDLFDPEREVEGQIFQLGMKLDDLHDVITDNLRNQPVEVQPLPSVQEMVHQPEIEIEETRPDTVNDEIDAKRTNIGAQRPSKIPLFRGGNTDEPHHDERERNILEDEDEVLPEEEDESPSPPFTPSSPERMSPVNEHYDTFTNASIHHQHQHQQGQETPTSELTQKALHSKNRAQQSRIPLHTHPHPSSPRSRTTGSTDHLDIDGRQKSPDADFDSGFMGSESSRQSNQNRPFGYKQPGLDGFKTRTKDHKGPSHIPRAQRLQQGQRLRLHGNATPGRESPLQSEEDIVSESEDETVTRVPVRKHSRGSSGGSRQTGSTKAAKPTRETHSKHSPKSLVHSPPHQSTPPSKHHQRKGQAMTPPQAKEQVKPRRKEPTLQQTLKQPHQKLQPERTANGNGYKGYRDNLNDDYITPTRASNNALKSHKFRPSNETIRPNRTSNTRPHETTPSAIYDSGSEVTRSSAKSEAMHALQDEIRNLKRQLKDKDQSQQSEEKSWDDVRRPVPNRTPIDQAQRAAPNRTRIQDQMDFENPSRRRSSVTGSNRSDAVQALRQELEDIKEKLNQKENTPISNGNYGSGQRLGHRTVERPLSGQQSMPLRDNLTETLRSQYIPETPLLEDSYSRTPVRDSYSKMPARESYSRTPARESYLSTPARESYSRTPARESYSRTPARESYSRTPARESYSRTPARESYTRTPARESYSQTPARESYARTPLRDLHSRSRLPQTPMRTEFQTHESPHRTDIPPRLHVSDLDTSPPPPQRYASHTGGNAFVSPQVESCPMCGGSGAHSHGQYQYQANTIPPPQPVIPLYQQSNPAPTLNMQPHVPPQPQPQPAMQQYPQSPPQGYAYTPPVITSTPMANPLKSQPTFHPPNQSTIYPGNQTIPDLNYATMPPQPTQQYAATPGHVAPQPVQQYASQDGTHQRTYPATTVQTQPTVIIRDEPAQMVYVTPSRKKGRYYSRDESSSSSNDDDIELYYRRTPRSSSSSRTPRSASFVKSPAKSILRKSLHSEVTYTDDGLDRSLDSAVSMARRLKRSSHRLVTSARVDMTQSPRESRVY